MARLTARDIIALEQAKVAQTRKVPIGEWGEFVLRQVTVQDKLEIQELMQNEADAAKWLIVKSVVEPPFSKEDVDALFASTTDDAIAPLLEAVRDFNKLGGKAQAEQSFPG